MPRSDRRSTADLLRKLVGKATPIPWLRTVGGEIDTKAQGFDYVSTGMGDEDGRLIVALANVAPLLVDVLEGDSERACRECGHPLPRHSDLPSRFCPDRCAIGALDAALRNELEGKP